MEFSIGGECSIFGKCGKEHASSFFMNCATSYSSSVDETDESTRG
jgi:hypothetical protein